MPASIRTRIPRLSLRAQIVIALSFLNLYLLLSGAITLVSFQRVRAELVSSASTDVADSAAHAQIIDRLDATSAVLLGIGAAGLLAAVLTTIIVPRQLTTPLRRLQAAVDEISAGNLDARVVVAGSAEVAQLAVGFNQMADTIQRQIRELDQSAVVQEQNRQLQELLELVRHLENPVIALYHDVLLVPLIGHIDERRADQIRGATLNAIHERRAQIVLVDITGVAQMTAQVATHLQQLASGARLMGARVILTGVRAETARALVDLGLNQIFETMGQLQDGVTYVTARGQHSLN